MVEETIIQTQCFVQGFYDVIPLQYIKSENLNEEEFGLILNGNQILEVQQIQNIVSYYKYNEDNSIIRWLFEILEEFEQDKRKLFLYFVTGAFSICQNTKIYICQDDNTNNLPVSHICSFSLDLPQYDNKEILREKLNQSLEQQKAILSIS
ncbi:ubiquitin- hect domain protein, putative [Ichthyophthirius multifiliis]|uniref:HECT-type E3 ubiquitin transferase n=1 Tax=Ichthyophthirius multifiliis TaxID=5932 RepID=G0QSD2_ICHMU|nr:ubiquitin- hect domain protein, putative [Ichthyophthirius multifiliis]EGR31879.1 ubiquitin- hect domain protein, putative [Ichthyophthirius multifiliis]|eukprot:XP_004035365.1 ubiquitin- hect domain protein, putative [Ichthyophthirius multifiliis]